MPSVWYSPDIVFSGEWKNEKSDPKITVISVIDLRRREKNIYIDEYQNFILNICDNLSKQGEKIVLFSMCQSEGDTEACNEIYSKIDDRIKKNVKVVEYSNITDSIALFSSSNRIVATRFHATILGLYFNKPVISISYSDKVKNALESYDVECEYLMMDELKNANIDYLLNYSSDNSNSIENLKNEAKGNFFAINDSIQ